MLVCQCNLITQREVEDAILALLEADPWQLIVPAKVYHALKRRGRCCGCFPNVVETIIRVTEAFHARSGGDAGEVAPYLDRVRDLRAQWGGNAQARRTGGNRAA